MSTSKERTTKLIRNHDWHRWIREESYRQILRMFWNSFPYILFQKYLFILWYRWQGPGNPWPSCREERNREIPCGWEIPGKGSEIADGDKVLLTQRGNELCTIFEGEPYEVVSKKGNSVTVQKNGARYKRNVTHVKKYREPISGDNACEPNHVNVKSPEFEKSESVPDMLVNSPPVRTRKLHFRVKICFFSSFF